MEIKKKITRHLDSQNSEYHSVRWLQDFSFYFYLKKKKKQFDISYIHEFIQLQYYINDVAFISERKQMISNIQFFKRTLETAKIARPTDFFVFAIMYTHLIISNHTGIK